MIVARARVPPRPVDLDQVLERFREHSYFYRRRLEGVGSWREAPVLEKHEIASIPPVSIRNEYYLGATSGTSGRRVEMVYDSLEVRFHRVLLFRPYQFYGLPERTRQATLVDRPASNAPRERTFPVAGYAFHQWLLSTRAPPELQLEQLLGIRPHLLTGITSGLVRLAEVFGRQLRRCRVQAVSPAGEYLCAKWRSTLEEAFGSPVYDRYGSTECGATAWQCPYCGRYHANTDEIILEPDPEGVLVTPLFLTTQPLLRYRLEDRIQWDEQRVADCAIKLPTIKIIEARRDDWLFDGQDRKVSPLAFQFESFPDLISWRIHQSESGSICLFVDVRGGLLPTLAQRLCEEAQDVVRGREVTVVEGTASPARFGKFKRVVSDYVCDEHEIDRRR